MQNLCVNRIFADVEFSSSILVHENCLVTDRNESVNLFLTVLNNWNVIYTDSCSSDVSHIWTKLSLSLVNLNRGYEQNYRSKSSVWLVSIRLVISWIDNDIFLVVEWWTTKAMWRSIIFVRLELFNEILEKHIESLKISSVRSFLDELLNDVAGLSFQINANVLEQRSENSKISRVDYVSIVWRVKNWSSIHCTNASFVILTFSIGQIFSSWKCLLLSESQHN